MSSQQESSAKGRQYRRTLTSSCLKEIRSSPRLVVCGEEPLNREWRQVRVTHLAWWHGSVVAYLQSAQILEAITDALRKIPILSSNRLKANRPSQANVQYLEQELRHSGSTIVLVQRHSSKRQVGTAWYRARVEKINHIRCTASVTLVDLGEFVINVPWKNLYSACLLEKSLRLAPGASPCLLQGFHPSCFQLTDPVCLRDHELWRSLNTTCWREEAVYEPDESQEIQLRSANLICANNGRSFEQMFSHILLGVTCLWRPNLLESSSRILRRREDVEVVMAQGDQLNVRISRFPRDELARLQNELSQLARDDLLASFPWSLQPGVETQRVGKPQFVAVPWGNGWERGEVLALWPSTSYLRDAPRAKIWLIDLGFSVAMLAENLRSLPAELADRLPRFGLSVRLDSEPSSDIPDLVTLDCLELVSSSTASAILASHFGGEVRNSNHLKSNEIHNQKTRNISSSSCGGVLDRHLQSYSFRNESKKQVEVTSTPALAAISESKIGQGASRTKFTSTNQLAIASPADSSLGRTAAADRIKVFRVVSRFSRCSATVIDVKAQMIIHDVLRSLSMDQLRPVDPRCLGLDTVVLGVPEIGPRRLIRGTPDTITRLSAELISVSLLNIDDDGQCVTVSHIYECPPEVTKLNPGRCKLRLDTPPSLPLVLEESITIEARSHSSWSVEY